MFSVHRIVAFVSDVPCTRSFLQQVISTPYTHIPSRICIRACASVFPPCHVTWRNIRARIRSSECMTVACMQCSSQLRPVPSVGIAEAFQAHFKVFQFPFIVDFLLLRICLYDVMCGWLVECLVRYTSCSICFRCLPTVDTCALNLYVYFILCYVLFPTRPDCTPWNVNTWV